MYVGVVTRLYDGWLLKKASMSGAALRPWIVVACVEFGFDPT